MDSPRGRIYLMRQGLEGEPMSDTMVEHFDRCLGCLACVTACPSGVQYDALIEATRQQVERRFPRALGERFFRELIYTFLPHPRRLHLLTAPVHLYQQTGMRRALRRTGVFKRLPARLRSMEELIPDIPGHRESVQAWTPAAGTERLRVGMLLGCVQRALFSDVNAATVRVLSADGCTVSAPPSQGCCGALSEHVGREKEALAFARKTIDVFESAGVDAVVVNVAGCGSMMKRYGDLLADDLAYAERARRFAGKVRDASELLEELGPQAERHPLLVTAVYHDACHLAHGQQVTLQPRTSLSRIPDLVLREVPRERDICCGSAGTYNLLEPDAGRELGERKARNILDADAELLVTANPGCHLQIEASLRRMGKSLPAVHVMQAVDASIRGDPVASLTHQAST